MPIYVYEIILPGGKDGPRFEYRQKSSDPPLRKHPETGQPVRRIIQAPNLPNYRYDRARNQIKKEEKSKSRF